MKTGNTPEYKNVTAEEFDNIFHEGGDVMPYVDLASGTRPNKVKRVNVDFPIWLVTALDKEAERRGITRQSLIKTWLVDKLEQPC